MRAVDRPIRIAEFDRFFVGDVRAGHRPGPELTAVRDTLRAALAAGCDDLLGCSESPDCPVPFTDRREGPAVVPSRGQCPTSVGKGLSFGHGGGSVDDYPARPWRSARRLG